MIEEDYAVLVATTACALATDCQILNGQCGVSLGGCYEVTNTTVTQGDLTDLGAAYADAGCKTAVCDCAPPPDGALCFNGDCVAAGARGAPCDVNADCADGGVCSCFNDGCNDCGVGGAPGGTCEDACLGG